MHDLAAIAHTEELPFDDDDVIPFTMYDTAWVYDSEHGECKAAHPDSVHELTVHVCLCQSMCVACMHLCMIHTGEYKTTEWLKAMRGIAITPVIVNNEYHPQFTARTGALTLFKATCTATHSAHRTPNPCTS